MSDEIKPALTPEEWSDPWILAESGGGFRLRPYDSETDELLIDSPTDSGVELTTEERHKIAALALYQQPFGFTREDVDRLRGEYCDAIYAWGPQEGSWIHGKPCGECTPCRVAARIEALLPPAETEER